MKKNFLYIALAGVALLLSGCSEDLVGDYVQPTEKHFGEEIMFGGSASYDVNGNGGTRTIYGGYNENNEKEPVYWIKGDQVRLYSPDAAVKTADYSVTATATDATGKATQTGLSKIGDAGLQWGVPTASHTFYGVYPIPADESLKEGTTLTGTIPDVQEYKDYTVEENGNVVYAPNMEYAYMVAKTIVPNPNNIGKNVYLKFMPIATAVEIELTNNAPTTDANDVVYNFREVHLSSSKHYLSGSFTADLDNMAMPTGSGVQYATASPIGITYVAADQSKQVAVKLYKTDGTAMSLSEGKTLKFTVFMLPSSSADASVDDAIDDLKITVVTSEGNKTGTLSGISVKKSKKTYMHAIPLGYEMTYNQSEWLKFVEDEKALNELSIPGAGGAASGNVFTTDEAANAIYLEQTLSIDDLWDQGIRCFEFTVDKNDTDNGDLGNVNVFCNGKDCGIKLYEAVKKVKDKLTAHPKEFAMVIITYQQQSGWNVRNESTGKVDQSRVPATFMTQLNTFWKEVTAGTTERLGGWPNGTGTALYTSSANVGDSRGKLFCIARPTSNGEDNYALVNDNSGDGNPLKTTTYPTSIATPIVEEPNILVIHGWGALKDKWYARGFTDCVYKRGNGNSAFKAAISKGQQANLGYNTINSERPGRPFDVSNSGEALDFTTTLPTVDNEYCQTSDLGLNPNFYYSTITKSDNGSLQSQKAWVQEWARVEETGQTYVLEACTHVIFVCHKDGEYVHWLSSLQEKKNNIEDCFNFALSKEITVNGVTEKEKNDVIFINSLCGYFIKITETDTESATPNSLTDCNAAYTLSNNNGNLKFNKLTSSSSMAGMSGDIASFASHINAYFKGLLDTKLQNGRLGGSTGIVLMDRVSNEGDGAAIPSIIIANNFAPEYNTTTPTVPTSTVEEDDAVLSREGVNIVWGEWE